VKEKSRRNFVVLTSCIQERMFGDSGAARRHSIGTRAAWNKKKLLLVSPGRQPSQNVANVKAHTGRTKLVTGATL
jgi:hypothetical protein